MADHFGSNGSGKEFPAIVDGKAGTDHFRENDHIATVSPDNGFMLAFFRMNFTNFFEEANMARGETPEEGATLASREEVDEFVHG